MANAATPTARAVQAIERATYYLGALLMLAMTGTMVYAVTMRYFFNRPPMWSEDVPRIIFIWMVFLVAGLAIKRGLNIRCTYFVDPLPRRMRLIIELCMHAIVLAMIVVLFWQSFPVVRLSLLGTMLSTGWSNAVATIPLPIGCVIIFIYQAARAWRTIEALRGGGEDDGPVASELGAGMG